MVNKDVYIIDYNIAIADKQVALQCVIFKSSKITDHGRHSLKKRCKFEVFSPFIHFMGAPTPRLVQP